MRVAPPFPEFGVAASAVASTVASAIGGEGLLSTTTAATTTSSVITENLLNRTGVVNYTQEDYFESYPHDEEQGIGLWIFLAFLICVNVVTVVGNLLILFCYWLNPNLHIPANIHIVSLSVSDLALGILVLPFAIMKTYLNMWPMSDEFCKAWLFMDLLLSTISIFNLINIAIDRFEAVRRPFTYSVTTSIIISVKRVVVCWLVGVVACLPMLKLSNNFATCGFMIEDKTWLANYLIAVCFLIPLVVLSLLYIKIFTTFKERLSSRIRSCHVVCNAAGTITTTIQQEDPTSHGEETQIATNVETKISSRRNPANPATGERAISTALARERRLLVVMVLVVGCFICCYLPFWTCFLVILNCSTCAIPSKNVLIFLQWLAYSNSALNPIIYNIFNSEYRNAARIILRKLMCRKDK